MMDPVIVALTTLTSPAFNAIKAIISSVALPNVALSNPPNVGPATTAISSVAVPIQAARGMMAIQDVINTTDDPHSKKCAAIEMGTNSNKMDKIVFLLSI